MIADTYIVSVEGAIIREGLYLMVVRGEEESAPRGLSLPGGKVESASSTDSLLEQTLRREIAEEVGLEIHDDVACAAAPSPPRVSRWWMWCSSAALDRARPSPLTRPRWRPCAG